MIMKKSAFMLLIILLSLTANAQTPYRNEDGKKIDKGLPAGNTRYYPY